MRTRLSWILAGATLVLVVADPVVTAQYHHLLSEEAVAVHGFPFVNGAVVGCAVMGALIITRDDRHPIGWLLSLIGFTSAISLLCEAYAVWVVDLGGPGSRGLGGAAGWLSWLLGGQFAIAGLALMFLLAPNGHFLSPRWRYAALIPAFGVSCYVVALITTDPRSFDISVPSRHLGPFRSVLFSVGFLLISAGLIASLVSMLVRLHRSRGEQHRQLRLIAASAAFVTLGLLTLFVVQSFNGGQQTWAAALPLFVSYLVLPILFAVAVLRYRLYDIELIINRTVVLVIVTAFAGLGYTGLVVAVGRLVDTRTSGFWLSLLTTVLVALAFQPLRRRVIRLANRLAYGARAQPYEALSDFSRRLAETPSSTTLLRAVADAAGRAVSARRATAALDVPGGPLVSAVWGPDADEVTAARSVPVQYGGTTFGSIDVWIPKGLRLRVADQRLLEALAAQAAVAFRNTAIQTQLTRHVAELDRATHELALSRSRIIEADDEARRTLEDAISREVLPHLVALPDAIVRARVAVSAGTPANGIDQLVTDTNAALESLRDLTRGVFPNQLARNGLEPALRSFLARSGLGSTLNVAPSASGQRFSPRVEAAVYFCCTEAARAASGPTSIRLSTADQDLRLRVIDVRRADIDLRAITDRAEAVGGSLSVHDRVLTLTLPVGADLPASVGGDGVLPRL
ncbi:MAG: hypothetical protein JWO11_3450 [Nocardioides sp.]|nr:hypothetical protein [Nocardioides sp.]